MKWEGEAHGPTHVLDAQSRDYILSLDWVIPCSWNVRFHSRCLLSCRKPYGFQEGELIAEFDVSEAIQTDRYRVRRMWAGYLENSYPSSRTLFFPEKDDTTKGKRVWSLNLRTGHTNLRKCIPDIFFNAIVTPGHAIFDTPSIIPLPQLRSLPESLP